MGRLSIIALVWILLFAMALIVIDDQLTRDEFKPGSEGKGSEEQENGTSQTCGSVELRVNGCLAGESWIRGFDDLPMLECLVNYTVANLGNSSANSVTLEFILDSEYLTTRTIHDLMPNSQVDDSIQFSVGYDQSKMVEIEASCGNTSATWDYSIEAFLPRQPLGGLRRLFITPEEEDVQGTFNTITSRFALVNWIEFRDWVGRNIEYVDDDEAHNRIDYWQLSRETLESGTGDCEDFAILLCSLLRADGWSAEDVYVTVGQNEAGQHHAWVRIRIPFVGIWYNIEPQLDGWNTVIGDFIALHGYTAICHFNDQYYVEL